VVELLELTVKFDDDDNDDDYDYAFFLPSPLNAKL
jgi:hypothetical protein